MQTPHTYYNIHHTHTNQHLFTAQQLKCPLWAIVIITHTVVHTHAKAYLKGQNLCVNNNRTWTNTGSVFHLLSIQITLHNKIYSIQCLLQTSQSSCHDCDSQRVSRISTENVDIPIQQMFIFVNKSV